jgi:putative membrane protein
MAWTRTAASLISFGFSIYKFFQGSRGTEGQSHPLGYITFSMTMISVGLISLVFATLQHRRDTRDLEARYNIQPRYLTPITAGLIGGLGILGLLAVLLRQ